jgi:hypothetical protein
MVIFQTPDGNPGYNQFETLDEAVRFVEKLRNEQSVETARMFALEEVTFDFKPYFRVQLDPPAVTSGQRNDSPVPSSSQPSAPPAAPSNSAPSNGQAPYSPPAAAPAPTPASPPVTFGEPPAPAPAPAAPVADIDSPVGGEPATVGAASPPPPTFMSPPSPNANPEGEGQTTRRGLFGR